MSDESNLKTQETQTPVAQSETKVADSSAPVAASTQKSHNSNFGDSSKNDRGFKKNRRTSKRAPKQKSEFDQKILDIRRVTRVSSGGRRFSFSVAIVVGNKKGRVGIGTEKAGDTSIAIDKAVKDAQKNAMDIKTTKTMSIPHGIESKFNSARVIIMPAPGRGVIAGSALRDVIELGGLNDLNGKILSGSKNKLNIARATLKAFSILNKTVIKESDLKNKTVKK